MSKLEMDRLSKKIDDLVALPNYYERLNSVNFEAIERNSRIIAEITIDQLDLIENDLKLYEKVSLCFLLYGHEYGEVALQKLQIAAQIVNSSRNVYMLAEWVRTISRNAYLTEKWREIIIEALCIVQINHVLVKLGLDLDELNSRFFPCNPDYNQFVHPVLKCLYLLSENLTPKESEAMICWIDRVYVYSPEVFCPGMLELHILGWINNAVIKIGDWCYGKPNKNMKKFADVKAVVAYLAESKILTSFKMSLESVVVRLNLTKNNFIMIDPACEKKEKLKQDSDNHSIDTSISDSSTVSVLSVPPQKIDLAKSSSTTKLLNYVVRKETAGYILVINQREFEPIIDKPKESLKPRCGTDIDRDSLIKTFSRLGYRHIIRENLKDVEILYEVRKVARDSHNMDSLIVCILSHGKLGTVFSSNNVQVSIEHIKSEMATNELKDKPKMLIIQACQEVPEARETQQHIENQSARNIKAENFQNMLTAHSTIGGFVSYRNREEGTWFIQALCKLIEVHAEQHHISDIFTLMFQEFQDKKGPKGELMVPHVSKTLSKNFYLPK